MENFHCAPPARILPCSRIVIRDAAGDGRCQQLRHRRRCAFRIRALSLPRRRRRFDLISQFQTRGMWPSNLMKRISPGDARNPANLLQHKSSPRLLLNFSACCDSLAYNFPLKTATAGFPATIYATKQGRRLCPAIFRSWKESRASFRIFRAGSAGSKAIIIRHNSLDVTG